MNEVPKVTPAEAKPDVSLDMALDIPSTEAHALSRKPEIDGALAGADTSSRREMHFCELIVPQLANHYGTLFAPNGLALLGKAAYMAGARFCQQSVVMAAAKQIDFLKPIHVGVLLNLHARVTRVGRSSMTVQASACLDVPPGTPPEVALRGEFELVAVDASGRPSKLNVAADDAPSPLPTTLNIDPIVPSSSTRNTP